MRFSSLLSTLLVPLAFAEARAADVPVQVDMHLDTPSQLLGKHLGLDAPEGLEAGLSQLREGGTNVPVMVLWPPPKSDHKARTFALLAKVEAEATRLADVTIVRSPDEARREVAAGRIAVLVSLEGAHGLGDGDDWAAVAGTLHDRGLSLLGLTWSFSNRFAGSSGDGGAGLTDEGRALVAEARRLGLVIDVSHASRQTTMDACTGSPVPVIASHSNAFAVRAQPRNLTDEEIACIGATGGVIGLNFHATFVGPGATVAAVADHADHIAKVAGRAAVGLGSDFDGYIKKPVGLEDEGDVGVLWEELRHRGWSEHDIAGVRGENFMRAWTAVLAGAGR